MIHKCTQELDEAGASYETITLSQKVHSVKDVQEACSCEASSVVKTLIFVGKLPVMVILPGDKKADLAKLKLMLEDSTLRMATPDEVLKLTGYTVGSVSPFGIGDDLRKIADESLLLVSPLILGSGKEDVLLKLTNDSFLKAFRGTTASISN